VVVSTDRDGAMPMRAARPTPPLDLEGFLDWEERRHERYELAGGAPAYSGMRRTPKMRPAIPVEA
jgi:hypothetical protein